ncbi:hypothetical protein BH09ACT7_BH09ACT7_09510 [soil metagenome]
MSGLSSSEIASLNARARTVGNCICWELGFEVADDPRFGGLRAGAEHVFVWGPRLLAELTVEAVGSILDELLLGTRRILDEDVPRLV